VQPLDPLARKASGHRAILARGARLSVDPGRWPDRAE